MNRYIERPPFKASESQFKLGFQIITPTLTSLQRSILEHQLSMPGQACFASDLAKSCGQTHHGPVNRAYASIAQQFCDAVNFDPPQREGDGHVQWWSILSTAESWGHGRWKWHMHPELVSALRSLGWQPAESGNPSQPTGSANLQNNTTLGTSA